MKHKAGTSAAKVLEALQAGTMTAHEVCKRTGLKLTTVQPTLSILRRDGLVVCVMPATQHGAHTLPGTYGLKP